MPPSKGIMKLLRIELSVMYAILGGILPSVFVKQPTHFSASAVACVSPLLTCVMFYKQPRFVLVDIVHARNGQSALPQPPKGSNHEPTSLGGKTIPSGTSTPTGAKDGNILFECSVCKRQVSHWDFLLNQIYLNLNPGRFKSVRSTSQ